MPGIFISYRRIDSKPYSGRLFDRLRRRFGRDSVFMDIEGGIAPGEDFTKAIERAVNSVDAMVVVIGRQWLACTDKHGRRRVDNPEDWVRVEVAAALRRGIYVLPVLVDGATLPFEEELPEEMAGLVVKQKQEISDTRWDYDVAQIFRELEKVVPPHPEEEDQPSPWPRRLKSIALWGALTMGGVGASLVTAFFLSYTSWKAIGGIHEAHMLIWSLILLVLLFATPFIIRVGTAVRWVGWGTLGVLALLVAMLTIDTLTEDREGDYEVSVDPPQIRFSWDGGSSASESIDVTVTNTGRKKATFELSLYFSPELRPGVVRITDDTCNGQVVAAGARCSARLAFNAKWFDSDENRLGIEGTFLVKAIGKRKPGQTTPIGTSVPLYIRRTATK